MRGVRRLLFLAALVFVAVPGAALGLAGATGLTAVQCVSRAAPGCAPARLIASPTGFALSHDGRAVVVRSGVGSLGTLGVFARNPRTGRLTQLRGRAGCVARRTRACMPGRGLETPSSVTFGPDDRSVYVTASNGATLAHYRRAASGALVHAGCWGLGTGCRPVAGLGGPEDVEISADGGDLYVAGDRLVSFARMSSGRLVPGAAYAFHADALTLSRDETSLYAVGLGRTGAGSLVVFRRVATSGLLVQIQRLDSPSVPALRRPADVLVSRDDRHVYVASSTSAGVAIFTRNAATGELTFSRCVTVGGAAPCRRAPGLVEARSLATNRAGNRLYVAASHGRGGGLAAFRRDPATGALAQLGQISRARGLTVPNGVAVTPDGLYVLASSAAGVTVFRRTG
jgi:6-phosphogluconolactonase (cycloisomerase 2 family)